MYNNITRTLQIPPAHIYKSQLMHSARVYIIRRTRTWLLNMRARPSEFIFHALVRDIRGKEDYWDVAHSYPPI